MGRAREEGERGTLGLESTKSERLLPPVLR